MDYFDIHHFEKKDGYKEDFCIAMRMNDPNQLGQLRN